MCIISSFLEIHFNISSLLCGTKYVIYHEMLQENLMQAFCDFIANVLIMRYINLFFYKHYKLSEIIWLLDFFKFKHLKKEVFHK